MVKVSIIISTRNRLQLLLRRSLPSVFDQTFQDFDIIIIDDASEEKYCDAWDERIKYFKNKQRKGLAWNKNFGISKAKGEYIVFLDDDNEFHPDFLEETVNNIAAIDQAICVRKTIIYPEGKVSHFPKFPCSINDGFLIRKEVFEKIKFDSELQANEDADFGLEFFKYFSMTKLDKTLMTVYGSPIFNTTSYSDYTNYHLDGLAKFWLKHHDYKKYIGRMFLLSAESPRWFKYLYWLEEKLKRYYKIYF